MYLVLTDSSNREYRRYSEINREVQIDLRVKANIHLTKSGSETFFCTFNSEVKAGQAIANYTEVATKTIYVYCTSLQF